MSGRSVLVAGCGFLGVALARRFQALGWDVLGRQMPLLVFAVLMAALIVYKHRTNIARLRAGTEYRGSTTDTAEELMPRAD